MSAERSEFVQLLAADLKPIRAAGRSGLYFALWLAASLGFVLVATLASGPMRPGFLGSLRGSPQLLAELGFGLLATLLGAHAALRLAVPQPGTKLARIAPPMLAAGAWLALLLLAMAHPALEPSMLGKREGCTHWVLAFGAPPLVLGLVLLRRFAALGRVLPGAVLGLAAGALPAVIMQLACMYDPIHALHAHTLPVLWLTLAGAALAPLILRRI